MLYFKIMVKVPQVMPDIGGTSVFVLFSSVNKLLWALDRTELR